MELVLSPVLAVRHLSELAVWLLVSVAQASGARWILQGPAANASDRTRNWIRYAAYASIAAGGWAFVFGFGRVSHLFPDWVDFWGRGAVIGWSFFSVLFLIAFWISQTILKPAPEYSSARRAFLRTAQTALLAAPAAAVGYGVFIERFQLRLREQDIHIPNLPPDLHGLKLVQLTDIHLSPFLSVRELDRAIAMANETKAHIGLVTGDLITTENDPLELCLQRLSALRADAGILGCMGNHEFNSGTEDYAARRGAECGIDFLRSRTSALRFGNTTLNIAGVDYQPTRKPYLVGAERMVRADAFNLLLSHNPDVFPVAARQGYDLTIAGHTHGGQVRVEILKTDLNLARFFTPYVDGLYQEGKSSIFVSRGIGTIGIPARIGSTPEVALIRLWRT